MAVLDTTNGEWEVDIQMYMREKKPFIIVKHTPENVLAVRNFIDNKISLFYKLNKRIATMSNYITLIVSDCVDQTSIRITINPEITFTPVESKYDEKVTQLGLQMEFIEKCGIIDRTKVIINYSSLHNTVYIRKENGNVITIDPIKMTFGLCVLMILSSMTTRYH